jgi:hypothetical protein
VPIPVGKGDDRERGMAVDSGQRIDDLAEELTRRLGIPFRATTNGTVVFRDKLRVTDWAVPLMFDGHVARDHDALVPMDFVGHLLWPNLRSSRGKSGERPWWYCTLTATAAETLVDALRDGDERPNDQGNWVIGRDVLLEDAFPVPDAPRRRVA